MMHADGISYEGDVLDLGVTEKVVDRSGSWFKYNGDYLGQGKEKARQFLIENPEICEEIKQKVLAAGGYMLGGHPLGEPIDAEGAGDVKADAKVDAKTDAKTDAKVDAKADAKVAGKADVKADAKVDVKASTKTSTTEVKTTTKADAKKVEAKPPAPKGKAAASKTVKAK